MPDMSSANAGKRSSTLYVNNINEKIAPTKIKYVLMKLFERYGAVVHIDARRTLKLKGQAFVTYKDEASCEKAMQKLQGRPVFKKPIRITYAKDSSDEYKKLHGDEEGIAKRKELKAARAALLQKKEAVDSAKPSTHFSASQIKQWKSLPPNNILLLQNLSSDFLEESFLQNSFSKYSGYQRVRLIKFRKLAFIDFEQESHATACLEVIGTGSFGQDSLLSYAKK